MFVLRTTVTAALGLAFAGPAIAHETRVPGPREVLRTWELAPELVLPLAVAAIVYAFGARRLAPTWHRLLFWTGLASLALALLSPLHPLGESLFSAHMAQHELMMLVSAPLLVLSKPVAALLLGVPPAVRSRLVRIGRSEVWTRAWKTISAPSAAWTLHAAAVWGWHAPGPFQATLANDFVHALQHASFLGTAFLFWWALVHGPRGRRGHGAAVIYVFTTALHTGALGALLTFSPVVFYPRYSERVQAFGIDPLQDQQLGGLIMWVPAGVVYAAIALALLASWLRDLESAPLEGR